MNYFAIINNGDVSAVPQSHSLEESLVKNGGKKVFRNIGNRNILLYFPNDDLQYSNQSIIFLKIVFNML